MKGKSTEQVTSMILEQLEKYGINIQDCGGQALDNAVVMAVYRSSVQARMTKVNSKIEFVPCSDLNLTTLFLKSWVSWSRS